MVKTATIAGKEYPVSFGNAAIAAFEKETGVSISTIGDGTPYSSMLRLVYAGLKDGARKTKKTFSFEFEAFCDLIDDDPEALTRLMDTVTESMPVTDPDATEEKKVKAAAQ